MTAPTLQTARLTLRAPKLADFEHWAAFFASDRSRHDARGEGNGSTLAGFGPPTLTFGSAIGCAVG